MYTGRRGQHRRADESSWARSRAPWWTWTTTERIRAQLRELELQAEAQMHIQQELAQSGGPKFDPLEFDHTPSRS